MNRFTYAKEGLLIAWKTEGSFRVHILSGIAVLICAFVFQVRLVEWVVLLTTITTILVLELVNSVFERVLDAFKPRLHPIVKEAKDMMAGAVLLASFSASIIGIWIFLPYLRLWFF